MSTFLRSIRFGRSWVLPGVLGALLLVAVTGGAVAAIETDTVTSYWQGLWWSISLITTVGFVGAPPATAAGAALSVVLMIFGFVLLAMVGASMAALFVQEDEAPRDQRLESADERIVAALEDIRIRLDVLEGRLAAAEATAIDRDPGTSPT